MPCLSRSSQQRKTAMLSDDDGSFSFVDEFSDSSSDDPCASNSGTLKSEDSVARNEIAGGGAAAATAAAAAAAAAAAKPLHSTHSVAGRKHLDSHKHDDSIRNTEHVDPTWTWQPHPWCTPEEVALFLKALGRGSSNGQWEALARHSIKEGISGAMLLANAGSTDEIRELFDGLKGSPMTPATARTVLAAIRGDFASGSSVFGPSTQQQRTSRASLVAKNTKAPPKHAPTKNTKQLQSLQEEVANLRLENAALKEKLELETKRLTQMQPVTVEDILSRYTCPITTMIMNDPVACIEKGQAFTFERSAIESWLATGGTNPMTRQPLTPQDLHPAEGLQLQIAQLREAFRNENEAESSAARIGVADRARQNAVASATAAAKRSQEAQAMAARLQRQVLQTQAEQERLATELEQHRRTADALRSTIGRARRGDRVRIVDSTDPRFNHEGVVVKDAGDSRPFRIRFDAGLGADERDDLAEWQVARLALPTLIAACGRPSLGDKVMVVDASTHLMGAIGQVVQANRHPTRYAIRLSCNNATHREGYNILNDLDNEDVTAYLREDQVISISGRARKTSSNDGFQQKAKLGGNVTNPKKYQHQLFSGSQAQTPSAYSKAAMWWTSAGATATSRSIPSVFDSLPQSHGDLLSTATTSTSPGPRVDRANTAGSGGGGAGAATWNQACASGMQFSGGGGRIGAVNRNQACSSGIRFLDELAMGRPRPSSLSSTHRTSSQTHGAKLPHPTHA